MSGLTVKRDLYPEQNNKNVKISIPVINPEIYQMPRRTKRSSILGRLTVLCGKALLIRQDRVVVGRNSDNSQTHFQVGDCSAISIRHFTLYFEKPSFWSLMVHSENGLLVDDVLQCSSIKLFHIQNKRCWIRFPGTSIVVLFENFTIDGDALGYFPWPSEVPATRSFNEVVHSRGSKKTLTKNRKMAESAAKKKAEKPLFTYAQLIYHSIRDSINKRLSLKEICDSIMVKYEFYRNVSNPWKKFVQRTLNSNRAFLKEDVGNECYWKIVSRSRKLSHFKEKATKPSSPLVSSSDALQPGIDLMHHSPPAVNKRECAGEYVYVHKKMHAARRARELS